MILFVSPFFRHSHFDDEVMSSARYERFSELSLLKENIEIREFKCHFLKNGKDGREVKVEAIAGNQFSSRNVELFITDRYAVSNIVASYALWIK